MAEAMLVLHYEYVDDIVERRKPYRDGHLAHIETWHRDGRLALAGAVGNPPHGGLLIFRTDDPAEAEALVNDDPYQVAGLITRWWTEPYAVVVS